jgi:uncharacterized membrane protein YcaP (DUF421 family)
MVKAEPRLLFHEGQFLRGAMRAERVTEEEIRAAVRAQGTAEMDQVGAVVLETDASFSVLTRLGRPNPSALQGVRSRRET